MKKILFILVFASLLGSLVLPMKASAQSVNECCKLRRAFVVDELSCAKGDIVGPTGGNCSIGTITPACTTEKWGVFCVLNTIYAVTDWIFLFVVAIVVVLVVIGAVTLMTSAGNPEKVTQGRNEIMYAAIGMVVAVIARAVPSIVRAVMGY